jgi:diguanylate cyclase (GGDEF)-like protein
MSTVIQQDEPGLLRVLHVEDDMVDARYLQATLKKIPLYRITYDHVSNVTDALSALKERDYQVIFLDLNLPDGYGLSLVKTIKTVAPEKPIVILSGNEGNELTLEAVQSGAQDYLVKDQLNANIALRAIRYAIDRKEMERRLIYLSQYDHLTGLANRHLFTDRLEQALVRARRQQTSVALMFVDLDYFKSVNDTFGHETGDLLLQKVSERLRGCVREDDTVARLGGDEFVIILEGIHNDDTAARMANKIIEILSRVFVLGEYEVYITASIGISVHHSGEDVDVEQLMKYSDLAMYQAKDEGKNDFKYFTSSMRSASKTRIVLEKSLRNALANEEFLLAYQPQIDRKTNQLVGAEALIRWRHDQFGILNPNSFMPILKETNQIFRLNEWVLRSACNQWKQWLDQGVVPADASISVNLCARQFSQKNLLKLVSSTLQEAGLESKHLGLEITEDVLLSNSDKNVRILRQLKEMGVKLALDDFGTGFCSLSYLKYFPVDQLKVDRSFVKDILLNESDIAIAASIITLANTLRIQVVAEGVDAKAKVELLNRHGCRLFQGFYYSPPLFPQEFAQHYNAAAVSSVS